MIPVGDLRRQAPSVSLQAAGRVVAIESAGWHLADEAGVVFCRLPAHAVAELEQQPGIGDWWVVSGQWDGEQLLMRSANLLQACQAALLDPQGDWHRFSVGDGLLAKRLRLRHRLFACLRQCFDEWGFLEVETPLLTSAPACEPYLTSFELHSQRPRRWLITSPELPLKRLLIAGFSRIFQLGKVFRAEEFGVLHAPEFTMVEWYRTFAGFEQVMLDTELLVGRLASLATGDGERLSFRGQSIDIRTPWQRLSVEQAVRRYAGVELEAVLPDEERFFRLWVERVQPQLGLQQATFVIDWPVAFAANARLVPQRPAVAERFESYLGGIELCNGYGELIDPLEQRRRWEQERRRSSTDDTALPLDEAFLSSMRLGLPPCSGNALGVDRLLMLLMDAQSIGDVMAFAALG